MQLSHLQIRNPREDETSPEAAVQIFSSLLSGKHNLFARLFKDIDSFSFELFLTGQSIYYYVTVPTRRESLVNSLIQSAYPVSFIQKTSDPLDVVLKNKYTAVGDMRLRYPFRLPIKTYQEFSDVNPLSSLVGLLSKQEPWYRMILQIIVTPPTFQWQDKTLASQTKDSIDPTTGEVKTTASSDNSSYLKNKVLFQGGRTAVRILATSKEKVHDPKILVQNVAGTFGTFGLGEGNHFELRLIRIGKNEMIDRIEERRFTLLEHRTQILNAAELATL